LSVASLGSASVVVAFTPLGTGAKSGALIFTHNGLESPDSVPVFGSGFVGPSGIVVHSGSGVGWQLISLPVSTPCPFIFPGAFQFVYQRGYVRADTLANGPGYWKKLATPDLTFTGYSINADTIPLTPGWNMIGTISLPVDTGAVATVPTGILITGFYGFTGSGYGIEDTLFPGRGYWVKSTQHGQLILDASAAPRPDGTFRDWLAGSSRVRITDAGGNSQSLYFMKSTGPGFVAEYFELPPVPPSGIFDARFASGRILEVLESGSSNRCPIVVSSAEYPLSIQWEPMPDDDNAQIVVGSRILPMSAGGRIEVVDPQLRITLERGESGRTPREFSLGQNHPNPFNPTTRIVYGVKNQEFVELKVYDVLGREVSTLVNEQKAPGTYVAAFSAGGLSSGLYFYKIRAGSFVAVRKMVILK
jgi:hypothetical protein